MILNIGSECLEKFDLFGLTMADMVIGYREA